MVTPSNDPTHRQPALGAIETSSIARGVEALDGVLKMAKVERVMSAVLPRGKYIFFFTGILADVEQAMQRGLEIAGDTVVDRFIIPNLHPQVPEAMRKRQKVSEGEFEAVGMIETKEVASAVFAADAAVKAADVRLLEARNQPGGKGFVSLTGEVGAVRSAIAAGAATVKKDGMLISQIVIPYAHKGLLPALTEG